MRNLYYLALLVLLSIVPTQQVSAQGSTLEDAGPFCAGGAGLTFNNGTSGTGAQSGIDYGCLGSEPNPAWFFLQIDEPGNLTFNISQVSNNGTPIDVDFIAWGPFPVSNPSPADINAAPVVGCSYSTAATENFSINNAVTGSYYIVLITNYNGAAGQITLTQTGGNGGTNCDIVCPLSIDGGGVPACPVAILTAVYDTGTTATYQWYFNGAPIAGATSETYFATAPGDYSVVVNSDGCVADASAITTVPASEPAPTTAPPMNLAACDEPLIFDLTANDLAHFGLDSGNWSISYHLTAEDAQYVVNPIQNPGAYPGTDGQTIYISIQNFTDPCVTVLSFDLNICIPAVEPPAIKICDNLAPFDNGIAQFDLSVQTPIVLGTNAAASFNVTYHLSLADAENDVNPIGTTFTNTVNPQTIYVRMEEVASPASFSTTSFIVQAFLVPTTPTQSNIVECDSYTLPGLPAGSTYHSESGGSPT
ncbi:MAG: hypothetical protein IR153_09585, partial [Flavobacterium sp.]|nr:hypothetical protein [Flavobacterium sp.]